MMPKQYEYDFAVSYAAPDQSFVKEVVAALRARGLRVFYAPDEQVNLIGKNLVDSLDEVYLSKARFCLLFASKHYAERKWTHRVERPAAQERAIGQKERYIIPVRLDETRIVGLSENILDIRNASPKKVADLCVSMWLRDETPSAVSEHEEQRERLVLRVYSLTDLDTEILIQSFKPFDGWLSRNAHLIPVELHLPRFLKETLSAYEAVLNSQEFRLIDEKTQSQFRSVIELIRKTLFEELLRLPEAILVASQPAARTTLVLTPNAVELIRRCVLSKVVATARCLVTWQLKGFPKVEWARQFADCDSLWTPELLGGLAWLCRAEGSECHLWLDADIREWGGTFMPIRVFLPSAMVIKARGSEPRAENMMRFVAPQLLQRKLEGQGPHLLEDAFWCPERMKVTNRNEQVLECHHFFRTSLDSNGWQTAQPAIEAIRDEIIAKWQSTSLTISEAIEQMDQAAMTLGHRELFSSAFSELYAAKTRAMTCAKRQEGKPE